MSASITATMASRPKIHKLPRKAARFSLKRPSHHTLQNLISASILGTAVLMFAAAIHAMVDISDSQNSYLPGVSAQAASMDGKSPVRDDLGLYFEKSGQTIKLKDKDSTIVGQMAKIPGQAEQNVQMQMLSEVDKQQSQDLLSILGKY